MFTFISIGGVVIGGALLEKRLSNGGNVSGAKTVKTFTKFFLIGAGGWIVWEWVAGMVALVHI